MTNYFYNERVDIKEFIGEEFSEIKRIISKNDNERLVFTTKRGIDFIMVHDQDCCEDVHIDDIIGDLNDILDREIILAEIRTSEDVDKKDGYDESCTWTFYEIASNEGHVTLRWYGSSNGYYSESVEIYKSKEN